MKKREIIKNNVERVAAANDINMKNHLKDVKKQNAIFIKSYEKKLAELEKLNPDINKDQYDELSKEVNDMALAVKINENTIQQLELS